MKLSSTELGARSLASPTGHGALSLSHRLAITSRAMPKNAQPNRMLIKLPTIGYAESNDKPLPASSRCLLMKDRPPRETKPVPRTKSPALVDSFSKCLGVFMAWKWKYLDCVGVCCPLNDWIGSPTCWVGCPPIFCMAARRRAVDRLGSEPEPAGSVVSGTGLMLLAPRQEASSVQFLASNLCYGATVMDRSVSSYCLCSWRIDLVVIAFRVFTPV
jgi:hypothetical protein